MKFLEVKLNRFADQRESFVASLSRSDTTGKVGNIRTITCRSAFKDDGVAHVYCLRPACFNTLFKVPRGMSTFRWPAIVTVPRFCRCLNCRWLPRCRTICHPSSSISLITSRTFNPGGLLRAYTASDKLEKVKSRTTIGGIMLPLTRCGLPSDSRLFSMITGLSLKRKFLIAYLISPFST